VAKYPQKIAMKNINPEISKLPSAGMIFGGLRASARVNSSNIECVIKVISTFWVLRHISVDIINILLRQFKSIGCAWKELIEGTWGARNTIENK
jgi:hypothetical protein